MKNFFNAIGVADMEKVHSAMIAWILDDENDLTLSSNNGQTISKFSTFPQKDRSELLCSLFNVTPTKKFKSIKTCVEWNDIDILIETEDTKGCKEVWIIENKLKSQEHKSKVDADEQKRWGIKVNEIWQTEKYTHIIKDNYSSIPQHYVLLSLGGDTARCQTVKWEVCKYEKIYIFLNGLLQGNSSYLLVQEYNNSIGRIITELNNFLKSPVNYGRVFDKKMTKADKARFLSNPNNLLCIERYILENGLETIFQKQFLIEMVKRAGLSSYNIVIDDDNGIAEFDCTIHTVKDSRKKDMWLQVQFQGGTFKAVLIHENYRNNIPDDYIEIYGSNNGNTWSGMWYNKFIKTESFYRVNGPAGWNKRLAQRLGKISNPKPRIALDKKMPIKGTQKWYDYKDRNIVKSFGALFIETKRVVDYISKLRP